ncbi:MAG: DUF4190 domain-containing protein [Akkermansiaceae bacterium]
MSEWYYGKDGQQYGPVDEATIKARAATGEISATDLVWKEGMEKWLPFAELAEFSDGAAAAPAPGTASSPYASPQTNPGTVSPAGMPAAPPTSGLAIASLVCGILSLIFCYINALLGIPAVICGHMALKRTRPDVQPAQGGRGMAIAGLICGYIGIVIQIFIIAAIGFALSSGDFQKAMEEAERAQEAEVYEQPAE